MEYDSLLSAEDIPPADYDFVTPWSCCHCDKEIFSSRAEFDAATSELAALQDRCRSDDDDRAAAAALEKILSEHARGHLDQQLFVPPVLKVGTDIFIVDLLHCVQLNVAKT
eukprot:4164219-Pleurochrysis_carterae.AAC.1